MPDALCGHMGRPTKNSTFVHDRDISRTKVSRYCGTTLCCQCKNAQGTTPVELEPWPPSCNPEGREAAGYDTVHVR